MRQVRLIENKVNRRLIIRISEERRVAILAMSMKVLICSSSNLQKDWQQWTSIIYSTRLHSQFDPAQNGLALFAADYFRLLGDECKLELCTINAS